MPTPKKGARLGGSASHQKLIVANLATSLFEHGRITTTEAKARVLRPVAERLITKAKKGDLHNRRQVLATIKDKGVVHALFEDIAPRFADRPGGYTRITKLGPRKGDNAPMAVIELVTEEYSPRARTAPAGRTAAAPALAAPAPAEAPADEATQAPAEDDVVAPADAEAPVDAEAEAPGEDAAAEAPADSAAGAPADDTAAQDAPEAAGDDSTEDS